MRKTSEIGGWRQWKKNNYWNRLLFQLLPWGVSNLICTNIKKFEFKFEKIIGSWKPTEKVRKGIFSFLLATWIKETCVNQLLLPWLMLLDFPCFRWTVHLPYFGFVTLESIKNLNFRWGFVLAELSEKNPNTPVWGFRGEIWKKMYYAKFVLVGTR